MSDRTQVKQDLRLSFPAELRLLLECAEQQPDAQQTERIRAAAGKDIDWTAFLRLTQRHRVVPHAYLALSRAAVDLVPQSSMDALSQRFHANTKDNLLVGSELARICRATNEAGIPLMCFKGPALAIQAYGGLQGRQFKDLDLLVPPQHIVQAAGLLNRLGYVEQSAPLSSLRPRQRSRLMKFYKHVTLTNPSKPGVVVELHWQIANTGQFSAGEGLWNDSHQLALGEGSFHVLPPDEQIVFLAWHGGSHRWKRLSWLFDLGQAMRSLQHSDEATLLRTARALGVEKYMTLGLSLARMLTDSHLPATDCPSRGVQREMELSCRAMLADAMHYETKPLGGLFWDLRMSRAMRLRPESVFHTFAPRMEHIHLNGPLAYLKRLQQLQSLTWQLLVRVART